MISAAHSLVKVVLRGVIALFFGFLWCFAMAICLHWAPGAVLNLCKVFSGLLLYVPVFVQFAGGNFAESIYRHPYLGSFLSGALFSCAYPWETVWAFVYGHLWAPPNREVLIPIPGPFAFDPLGEIPQPIEKDRIHTRVKPQPLAWIGHHSNKERAEAWEALDQLFADHAGDGRMKVFSLRRVGFPKEGPRFEPFEWTVVIGPPGAGKTRLAIEYLRTRARWNDLEGAEKKRLGQRMRIRCGSWWRRVWPGARREYADLWDIGWTSAQLIQRSDGNSLDSSYVRKLEAWRPARPTALLYDDPYEGSTMNIVEPLLKHRKEFRYPVRLILVRQTLPDKLFEFDSNASRSGVPWKPRGGAEAKHFYPGFVRIGSGSNFTRREILKAARGLPEFPAWLEHVANCNEARKHLDTMHSLTEGNPLLVEIALHMLVDGKVLDGLTIDDLLRDRAASIKTSLEGFGLLPEHYRLLASAALGGPKDVVERAHGSFWREFKDPGGALTDCFNLYDRRFSHVEGSSTDQTVYFLPCVRPQLVADAFVKMILTEKCFKEGTTDVVDPQLQVKVTADAWRWNPLGILSAIGRNGGSPETLGRLLHTLPPSDVEWDVSLTARAFVRASALFFRGKPGPSPASLSALYIAWGCIGRLEGTAALDLLDRLYELQSVDEEFLRFYPHPVAVCALHCLGRALEAPQHAIDADRLFEAADKCAELNQRGYFRQKTHLLQGNKRLEDFCREYALHLSSRLDAITKEGADRKEEDRCRARIHSLCAWWAGECGNWKMVKAHIDALDKISLENGREKVLELERVRARVYLCYWSAAQGNLSCVPVAREIDQIVMYGGWHMDREFAVESARAHACVCRCGQLTGTDFEAEVKAIGNLIRKGHWEDDRDLALEEVNSLLHVCGWEANQAGAGCESLAATIDGILEKGGWRGDRSFDFALAEAYALVCHWKFNHERVSCEAAANKVLAVVANGKWTGDRDFARAQVQALQNLCCWMASVGTGYQTVVARLDALVKQGGWEQDAEIAFAQQAAHLGICEYTRLRPEPECEAEARVVGEIADYAKGDRLFEFNRAQAHRFACHWRANHGSALCVNHAHEVDRICVPFIRKGDKDFGFEYAAAWNIVCFYWSRRRGIRKEAEAAARLVGALADLFQGDAGIATQVTECRDHLARIGEVPPLTPSGFH